MSEVYFSPSRASLYPAAWKDDGTYTEETWPKDAFLISDEQAAIYWCQPAPAGKILGQVDGQPSWVDTEVVPPTPEQILASSRAKRDRLLTYATLRINPLQYAADVDEASEEDLALLKLWKKYSVAVSKTETKPGWPESPQWPEPPVPLETSSSTTLS